MECWRVLLTCFFVSSAIGGFTEFESKYTRKLSPIEINPNCNNTLQWCANKTPYITYEKAVGDKDVLHHLFGTLGAPSIMITRSKDKNIKLIVDYEKLLKGEEGISYSKDPDHSFGIIFSAIYEYNDTANDANFTNKNNVVIQRHSLENMTWAQSTENKGDYMEISLNASRYNEDYTGSSTSNLFKDDNSTVISFKVRYDSKTDRLESRPHIQVTGNSSIIELALKNLRTNSTLYTGTRFAVELIMISTDDKGKENNATQVATVKSLDDEYSPGVFQIRTWQADPEKPRESAWGYAQWKPVMYTSAERKNADIAKAASYPNINMNRTTIIDDHVPSNSLFQFYFGNKSDQSQLSMNLTNVSFGSVGDGFYYKTNYVVWSMAVGMGPAPDDGVSILVILVIAIGLGIPLILTIVSFIYVFYKNRQRSKLSSYEAINS